MSKIILASRSKGRSHVLEVTGLAKFFEYRGSSVEEVLLDDPTATTRINALNKARDVASSLKEGIVVGVDTVVYFNGKVLGKPKNFNEAFQMLKNLNGNWHEVYTSIAIVDAKTGRTEVATEVTRVKMDKLTEDEIKAYIRTGEPLGKAGGYAIQGLAALFIERIEGCYYNVVGLPLNLLRKLLLKFNINILKP